MAAVPSPPAGPGRPGPAEGPGAGGNWPGDEDWDQDASLAAFVAAVESGQCQPPPGDCGPGGGAGPLAMPAGGLAEGLWQFVPAAGGGPTGGRW